MAENKRAQDGSVNVVELSAQMENSMKRLEKKMCDHTKRVVNFEIKATESLTNSETLQNDFKKKLLRIGGDLIKVHTLRDELRNKVNE